ncbi:hypothetical protein [Sphingomonas sp. G-3-2-10]|uniref:hypothetical protein n=1 Tax=Sphingomonas sp. G-3-2-10 TaxID=2728838 RepID=UPI001469D4DA|nr:hypothetical protein [Sphingomonas sp. G-3-2-10]NML06853.1 hypothetical protein [Sphingomonas sp. G-3-2-10]
MSSTDDAIAAARASIARSRAPAPAKGSMSDTLVAGAAIGAVVSLPLTGVGLVAGAIVGAGVAALSKD